MVWLLAKEEDSEVPETQPHAAARRSNWVRRSAVGSQWWYLAVAAVLLAAFVGLACAARFGSVIPGWDQQVADAFAVRRSPERSWAFWILTLIGDDSLMAPLVGGLVVLVGAWGRRARAAVIGGAMVISWVIMHLTKSVAGRARPPAGLALIEQPGSHSMPSGHAFIGIVFFGLLVYAFCRWISSRDTGTGPSRPAALSFGVALLAAVVVAGVGVSRVYLGVHWASDVLAGWCLGGALLMLALRVATKWDAQGGPRLLRGSAPWGRRSRVVLTVVVSVIVMAAASLTAWTDPLL